MYATTAIPAEHEDASQPSKSAKDYLLQQPSLRINSGVIAVRVKG